MDSCITSNTFCECSENNFYMSYLDYVVLYPEVALDNWIRCLLILSTILPTYIIVFLWYFSSVWCVLVLELPIYFHGVYNCRSTHDITRCHFNIISTMSWRSKLIWPLTLLTCMCKDSGRDMRPKINRLRRCKNIARLLTNMRSPLSVLGIWFICRNTQNGHFAYCTRLVFFQNIFFYYYF